MSKARGRDKLPCGAPPGREWAIAPILSHAVVLIGRLRFATKPPQTLLTPSSAIEHEENGVPTASHNHSESEQPSLDSLENTIGQKRKSRSANGVSRLTPKTDIQR